MSRDPLDELFGPIEPDDADETPQTADNIAALLGEQTTPIEPPVAASVPEPFVGPEPFAAPAPFVAPAPIPANVAPTPAPARPSRDELPTAPVPAGGKRPAGMLPWIIVGGVTVLALIGSLIFISTINGTDDKKPETTTEAPVTSPDTESPATDPTEEVPSETPAPEVTKPPKVDPGNTFPVPISYAGITVEASGKLDPNYWYYVGGDTNRVTWESNLMNSFPDSCAAMRSPSMQSPWGIEQDPAGKWIVVRPEGTCAAAPDLYNQVWGLMQAIADSAKPLAAAAESAENAEGTE